MAEPVTIKKYANRRLYNTGTSSYVTLEDLAVMVKAGQDFTVEDAKTGEDITRSVLAQIIFEQENKEGGQNLLPINFLRQLIRFYGDTMERMVPSYLQVSLDTLTRDQDRFRKQFATAFTPHGAFEAYQEQARKNLAMFEQAMTMFTPFNAARPGQPQKKPEASGPGQAEAPPQPEAAAAASASSDRTAGSGELAELKAQLAAMQQKIEKLTKS